MEAILLKKGYIKNEDIRCALKVPRHTALRIAQKLVDLDILKRIGKGKGMKYMKHLMLIALVSGFLCPEAEGKKTKAESLRIQRAYQERIEEELHKVS